MSIQMLLGAVLLASALPVGWLAVASGRGSSGSALQRGLTDLRDIALSRPSGDRLTTPLVATVARAGRRVTPAGMVAALEAKLAAAGLGAEWSVERLMAAKLVLGAVGTVVGAARLAAQPGPAGVLIAAVLAFGCWYLPDFLVSQRADARRKLIQHALPDAMDQLTISVEAGLGFDAALAQVAKQGTGPLADELAHTLQDVQLGASRADALDALGERTGVADLQRFVAALRQAGRYGLPIAGVLRAQSAELRDRRRQRAEEHAQQIPVKVLFPLVLFILPTLFIVVLGPGILRFLDAGGLGG